MLRLTYMTNQATLAVHSVLHSTAAGAHSHIKPGLTITYVGALSPRLSFLGVLEVCNTSCLALEASVPCDPVLSLP